MRKQLLTILAVVFMASPLMLLSTSAAACEKMCCCPNMAGYSYTYPGSYYSSTYVVPNRALAWKVVSQLRADPATAHQPVAVSASGHGVLLSGSVGFKYQKDRAVDIARHTYGVNMVYDKIYVRNE